MQHVPVVIPPPPSTPPIGAREDRGPVVEAMEREILDLVANIHAATYRLLLLIRSFDEHLGWAGWGVKSCAHWLNWRCGIGLVAAREKVRVAHALVALPRIGEAFRRGEVSYSKVRAMTRVATPDNEDYLLMIARHGTAAHVEKLVRKYRKVRAVQEAERARRRQAERRLDFRWDEDGTLVVTARMPPQTGARFLAALDAALDVLAGQWEEERTGRGRRSLGPGTETARGAREPSGGVDGSSRQDDSAQTSAGADLRAEPRADPRSLSTTLRHWRAQFTEQCLPWLIPSSVG